MKMSPKMSSKVVILFLMIGLTLAYPARNELLDKANADDVFLNSVHSDEETKIGDDKNIKDTTLSASSTSTQSVGLETVYPPTTTVSNIRPGTAFSRVIDDIFQIPITVLQSVAKLLTNPFKNLRAHEEVKTR